MLTGEGRTRLAAAALVTLLAWAVYLPGIWNVPFADIPEPLEALVVHEMVGTGDWVLPRRNAEEIPAKPPLFHWVAATLSLAAPGGVSEMTARLPSTIFAGLGVGIVFLVGAARFDLVTGAAAALALGTAPEWVRWAIMARTDVTLAFFLAVAFLLGERWLRDQATPTLLAFAAAAGAAVLVKGPAGVGLPVIVMAVELTRRGAWKRVRPLPLLAAAGLFVTIAGSWYAAALWRGGGEFFQKQILSENLLRFFPSEEGGPSRAHSILFYLPMLLAGMFPWSLAVPVALRDALRDREGFPRYLVAWLGVVFVVCSAASGKRSNYILPLYPAAALLVGIWLGRLVTATPDSGTRRAMGLVGNVAAGFLAMLAAVLVAWRLGLEPWRVALPLLHVRDRELVPVVAAALGLPPVVAIGAVVALGAALVAALRWERWQRLAGLFAATLVLAVLAATGAARPTEARLKTFEPFSRRVAARVDAAEPLRFFRKPQYAVLFYLRRTVPVEYVSFDAIPAPGWALVWEEDWERLPDGARRGAEAVEASPPAAPHRPASRLLLVRLPPPRQIVTSRDSL